MNADSVEGGETPHRSTDIQINTSNACHDADLPEHEQSIYSNRQLDQKPKTNKHLNYMAANKSTSPNSRPDDSVRTRESASPPSRVVPKQREDEFIEIKFERTLEDIDLKNKPDGIEGKTALGGLVRPEFNSLLNIEQNRLELMLQRLYFSRQC